MRIYGKIISVKGNSYLIGPRAVLLLDVSFRSSSLDTFWLNRDLEISSEYTRLLTKYLLQESKSLNMSSHGCLVA